MPFETARPTPDTPLPNTQNHELQILSLKSGGLWGGGDVPKSDSDGTALLALDTVATLRFRAKREQLKRVE